MPALPAPRTTDPSAITPRRLLDAAGEVFAEKGYRSATVREICERAHANVAAINYHFRGKEGLYRAVLRSAHRASVLKYPPDLGVESTAAPEKRLHAFVRSFMLRVFDEGQPAWFGKLTSREILEPTSALDSLVKDEIRPRWELVMSIVAEILGRDVRKAEVRLAAMSVVGQCLFYFHSRSVIERLLPRELADPAAAERLAEHITQFSLQALRGARRATPATMPKAAAGRGRRRRS
ncbi:MAG TPA: CerR family C-terminal domain-containing protein [Planctomycetota bacterium]|nr:CerR family C-terminal domain-containing protein [Planctomycetota bacterium]